MKILVPIKRVVDPYAKVRPKADGSGIDLDGIKFEINPFDEIALEEAVRLKEQGIATSIQVISIGPVETQEQLRKALAMGADEAILVESTQEWDSLGIAGELAAWTSELAPQLILMGKQATDDDNNQAAQMLSAKLDWPLACYASKVTVSGSTVTVARETDLGEETVEMVLPAVISTDLRLNEPRYIALPAIIKARSKPLQTATAKTSPTLRTKVTHFAAPAPRAAGRIVGSTDELVAALKERGVL